MKKLCNATNHKLFAIVLMVFDRHFAANPSFPEKLGERLFDLGISLPHLFGGDVFFQCFDHQDKEVNRGRGHRCPEDDIQDRHRHGRCSSEVHLFAPFRFFGPYYSEIHWLRPPPIAQLRVAAAFLGLLRGSVA